MSIVSSRGSDQFPIRLPDGVRDEIKREAKANGRSMNAEIVSRIISPPAMTQRDWFAGQALSAIAVDEWNDAERIALWAYRIADAMLKAREVAP